MNKEIIERMGHISFLCGVIMLSFLTFMGFAPTAVLVASLIMLVFGAYFAVPKLKEGKWPFFILVYAIVFGFSGWLVGAENAMIVAYGLGILGVPILIARIPGHYGKYLGYGITISLFTAALFCFVFAGMMGLILTSGTGDVFEFFGMLASFVFGGGLLVGAILFLIIFKFTRKQEEMKRSSTPYIN